MNRAFLLVALSACASSTSDSRGLDGEYAAPGSLLVSGTGQSFPIESRLRVSPGTGTDVDFVIELDGDRFDRCAIQGRWTEAGSDYFEPTQRSVCVLLGTDGIESFSVENDHAAPITGTLTAGGGRRVFVSLAGVCHLVGGGATSCSVDLNGEMR